MSSPSEIETLRDRLISAERAYWLDNDPIMPDTVYDELRRKYRTMTGGKERPIGTEGSGRKTLPSPMYSLDNVFNREEFEKWIRGVRKRANAQDLGLIVEYKHDGLSLSLHFKDGKLLDAYNRGDGKEGEVITDKLPKALRDITLVSNIEVEIRGEIFVTKSDFDKINLKRHENPYKTPRQCAVGILRGSDETFKDMLKFRVFGMGKGSDLFLTETSMLNNRLLNKLETTEIFYSGTNASDAFAMCEQICHGANALDFPIDGAVVKIDSTIYRNVLGYTSHHPRWAIAVKLKSEDYESKLLGVEWSVGVQGTITPTLLIEPVEIDGVTISRVTGDNATVFKDAKYAIGDVVYVKRAGDVIPKISRHKPAKEHVLGLPEKCPSCGSPTTMNGAYLRCSNGFMCDGQIEARLLHFVSRDAMDLKGFGVSAISWAMKECGITSGASLLTYFRASANQAKIFKHFGELVGTKLISACSKTTYPMKRVLYSLAIPNVGLVSAGKISAYIPDINTFLTAFGLDKVVDIPGINDSTVDSIRYWLDHPNLADEVVTLNEILNIINDEKGKTSNDKSVCFTGKGDGYDRGMLEQSAKNAGYNVSKAVTKKISFLVVGTKGKSSSKIDKAMSLKIPIITVQDWIKKTS